MNILEIKLKNPIDYDEIESLKTKLATAKNHDFLIIDTGKHSFVSIIILKYFKEQMLSLEPYLLNFKKIAFIHPPQFRNTSSNQKIYEYFTSKVEAKKWFSK